MPQSGEHSLLRCNYAASVWRRCLEWWGFDITQPDSIQDMFRSLVLGTAEAKKKKAWSFMFLVIAWSIWNA
ncbi:hypothetical protein SLA2020_382830 [Shorea laevis]